MIFFASNMNALAPLVLSVMLDAGYLLLFVVGLVLRSRQASRRAGLALLRFLAWAGLGVLAVAVLASVVLIGHSGWKDINGGLLVPCGITALLVGIVAATWREVRPTPAPTAAPKRSRDPEDW